jgi:iron complex transport system substrate-binding protein
VKERKIYPLPLYSIYSAGVRAYDGIQIIGKGLYGEV